MTRVAQVALYAVDPDRLGRFYAEVAGLRVVESDDGFVTLASDVIELHVVRASADIAGSVRIADPPRPREETPIKVSFAVPSIEAARAAARRLGGVVDGPDAEWAWRGENHCDGHDPEGNVFQVRASAPWSGTAS